MVQIGCCLHTCLDNIKGGMKRNNSLSVSLTENMITCRLSFTMRQDAKKAIAMSSLVLYLTCLFVNVKSKKQNGVPAPSSHGTHKCSSQTLAPTLCTPQVREGV